MRKSCARSVSMMKERKRLLHCNVSQNSMIISGAHVKDFWLPGRYDEVACNGWFNIRVIPSTRNWKSCGRCSLPKKWRKKFFGDTPLPVSGMGYKTITSSSCKQYVTRDCLESLKTTWSYGTRQDAGLYFNVVLRSEQRTDSTFCLSGHVAM